MFPDWLLVALLIANFVSTCTNAFIVRWTFIKKGEFKLVNCAAALFGVTACIALVIALAK